MAWKGCGKRGSTFLQQALQGAVVNALGLADFGTSKGKGKGKNAAKDKPAVDEAAAKAARTCTWADCRAAKNKTATWGAGFSCFACKRAFATKPPVELMADWAFAAAVEEKKALPPPKGGGKGKKGGKGGKSTGGAPASVNAPAPPPPADKDALARLRKERLELLKNPSAQPASNSAANDPQVQTPSQALADEMAKHLVKSPAKSALALDLTKELLIKMEKLGEIGSTVVKSAQGEKLPQTSKLEEPKAICAAKDWCKGCEHAHQ